MINELLFIDTYRVAFEGSNMRFVRWDEGTMYLYFGIIISVFVIGRMIEKQRGCNGVFKRHSYIWMNLCGILMAFVLGLRGIMVGKDTVRYYESFVHALDRNAFSDSTIEQGWRIINKVLRYFIQSPEFFIFIISATTVFFILNKIWKCRNSINIFVALLFYVGIYYFQALNLMRMYFAMSILFFFFNYLLEKRYMRYVVIVLLTSLIHLSSLVMLMVVGLLYLYQRSKSQAIIVYALAMASAIPLSLVFGDYIVIARYTDYASNNESSRQVGIMLLFDYLPCFVMIYYAIKNKLSNQWTDLLVVFTLVAFLMRFWSYFITAAGRLSAHFAILYVILIPYFVNHIRLYHRRVYPITLLLLVIFAAIRIHFYFVGYLATDGIMPYNFIWNN